MVQEQSFEEGSKTGSENFFLFVLIETYLFIIRILLFTGYHKTLLKGK